MRRLLRITFVVATALVFLAALYLSFAATFYLSALGVTREIATAICVAALLSPVVLRAIVRTRWVRHCCWLCALAASALALAPYLPEVQHQRNLGWFEEWKRTGSNLCPCKGLMCDGARPHCSDAEAYDAIVRDPWLFEPTPGRFFPYVLVSALVLVVPSIAGWAGILLFEDASALVSRRRR